ncbi:MAG: permease-like cell division protein FtsX [bacterium]|jgi:cell division transport system permease protein
MRFSTWEFYIRETLLSLRRNSLMSLASISTVALSFLILGLFVLLVVNLDYMADTLEAQVEIAAYLDPELEEGEIARIAEQIESLPGVRESDFVSRDEALDRLRKQFGERQDLLDSVEEMNPLRHSFEIRAEEAEQVKVIAREIGGIEGVAEVKYRQEVVERLFSLTRSIRMGGLVLVLLLLMATVFLISNTIRLTVFARRREIGIMKLVGATDWFIRWPFILEGILLGILGTLVSLLVLTRLYNWAVASIYSSLPFVPVVSPEGIIKPLSLLLLGLGFIVGAFGSLVSLRRFLRV